jgi:hypothetical protein
VTLRVLALLSLALVASSLFPKVAEAEGVLSPVAVSRPGVTLTIGGLAVFRIFASMLAGSSRDAAPPAAPGPLVGRTSLVFGGTVHLTLGLVATF